MKINIKRPKSLPTISRSSSHLSIQRPKSLPTISKRPLTSPKPIKTPLIYSPSSQSSQSTAMRSPPPSAKIDVIHPVDLSQYDTLLSPTHTHPLKIVAIYYITLIYTIIESFCINIIDILKRINNTDYIKPQLFKKIAIERLLNLEQNISIEIYNYQLLDGSIIDISGIYTLIDFFLFKKTIKEDIKLYNHLRSYLHSIKKLNYYEREIEMSKLFNDINILTTDADIEKYMRSYFNKNKVLQNILSNIEGIDINNKLKSQFKMIEELINIINDIWVDEKTKGGSIKFILKTQKTSGIQSGGMLRFLRSKRVLPEQVLHLNMYRRAHTANFQNIYDYLFLLNSYLFEVDDKMMQKSMKLLTKHYKKLIRDYEKEYKHIYKDPPIQKESIRSPMFLMNSKQYKLKQISIFTEMKQKNEDMLALEKIKLEKHIRGQNIKFHLKNNIKYIKDKIDSVENDLAHLFP